MFDEERCASQPTHETSTPVGFEPTRGDPIGLAGRRLSHSAKVSMLTRSGQDLYMSHCDMERGWKRECAASTQSHMVISTYLVDERCRKSRRDQSAPYHAESEDRTHDLRIMRPTRYQLRYFRLVRKDQLLANTHARNLHRHWARDVQLQKLPPPGIEPGSPA